MLLPLETSFEIYNLSGCYSWKLFDRTLYKPYTHFSFYKLYKLSLSMICFAKPNY
jgi:hypothetical protein